MERLPIERLWPEVPAELRYTELRLPGTFRELVANRNLTNEEIGRIVRCIALNSDFFITPRIEADVHYYIKHQHVKNLGRKRVDALRKRRLDAEGEIGEAEKTSVTVTLEGKPPQIDPAAPSPLEKTPFSPLEKTPPIVPLKKSTPSPLENASRRRTKKDRAENKLQQDLFSLVGSTCASQLTENGQGTPQNLSEAIGTINPPQDIDGAPRAVFGAPETMPSGNDSRTDAAWIPQKFAVFWERYPKKVAKQDACKAFTKLIKAQKDVDQFMATLMASIEWWKSKPNWKADGGKYIPYPATWLNRGSWEDSVSNQDAPSGNAEFLGRSSDSDDDLIRRMTGG